MPTIDDLSALEILDSRGRPTVCGTCRLASGALRPAPRCPAGRRPAPRKPWNCATAIRPATAAWGCRKAVGHINGEIRRQLRGRSFADQAALDRHSDRVGRRRPTRPAWGPTRSWPFRWPLPGRTPWNGACRCIGTLPQLLGQPITPPAADDDQPVQRRETCRRAGFHPGRVDRSRLAATTSRTAW